MGNDEQKPPWWRSDWYRNKRLYRERDPWREHLRNDGRKEAAPAPDAETAKVSPWGQPQPPPLESVAGPSSKSQEDSRDERKRENRGRLEYFWRGARRRKPWWSGKDWGQRTAPPPKRILPFRVIVMGLAFGAIVTVGAMAAFESIKPGYQPLAPNDVMVVDGDTIRISGGSQPIRLVGFNTPEKFEPACDSERSLGIAASERLERLVDEGELDLAFVRCACWPLTAGTDACNFGRACGTLRAGGQDVGAILIDEGLAVPFACGLTSCPPTPRPWCGEAAAIAPLIGAEPRSGSADCDIKGNISVDTEERIYHVPGQKFYERTVITKGKGERWFCSEAEARAAGWRKSRR